MQSRLPWLENLKVTTAASPDPREQRLVFTQMEAMNYGAQLCKALDEKEQDHGRKAFLQSVGKQCQDFHDGRLSVPAAVSRI